MAGRPRTYWETMDYKEALRRFPEQRIELEEDREFVALQLENGVGLKNGVGYCLHCGNKIHLDKMKVMVLCYQKTKKAVTHGDERFLHDVLILTKCETEGCDGGALDWKTTPWE